MKKIAHNLRMQKARSYGGYAYDSLLGFVMSGGMDDDDNPIAEVETTQDGVTFSKIASLPIEVKNHCLASLNNGGDLLVAGGHDGDYHLANAYVYRKSKDAWETVESMHTPRDEVICGPVRSVPDGTVEEVVVTGCTGDLKWYLYAERSPMVEIFNLKLERWRAGKSKIIQTRGPS